MMTNVMPTAIRPRNAPCAAMFLRFPKVRKLSNAKVETATMSTRTARAPWRCSEAMSLSRPALPSSSAGVSGLL
jgi:hypothetical protein